MGSNLSFVMPGLVPGIHVFLSIEVKTWMAGSSPAMTTEKGTPFLTISVQPTVAEYVDRALGDRQVGGALRRLEAERDHQRPCRAAMRHHHDVSLEVRVPVAHALLHGLVGLPALRGHPPFVGEPPGKEDGIGGLHLRKRRALPLAIADLAQPIVGRIVLR